MHKNTKEQKQVLTYAGKVNIVIS